jgi:hypothetical protein
VHACDIFAINILDRVFSGKYNDPYFQARRKNIAVIGNDCSPDPHCFCRSMRADFVDRGFDLRFPWPRQARVRGDGYRHDRLIRTTDTRYSTLPR